MRAGRIQGRTLRVDLRPQRAGLSKEWGEEVLNPSSEIEESENLLFPFLVKMKRAGSP